MNIAKRRALEKAAYREGVYPTRVFPVLFPVHEIEVRATIRTGRDYALIDKFLERSIAEGGITTIPHLAEFLRLDPVLVDRAVRVLRRIGHLDPHGDQLVLTDLARESLKANTCYEIRHEDRRKIYFDGYTSQPMHRRYYQSSSPFLAPAEATALRDMRFTQLSSFRPFRREALTALARNPDREKFNLPMAVENPQEVQPECVFLPLYLVRAVTRGGHERYLAYSETNGSELDEELSALCTELPEIDSTLQNERRPVSEQRALVESWLARKAPAGRVPFQHPDGSWQADFEAGDFQPDGSRRVGDVGSFVDLGDVVVRVWCQDHAVRRRAVLERAKSLLGNFRYRSQNRADRLRLIGDQLEFPGLDESRLRALAVEDGQHDLVQQLERLLDHPDR
ncbi:hypothetical protein OU415_07070 [Saccharopolyspora sp. WRP15-2]|uniref:Uncharacterized protein n=1 Tax=Saccharopolyspora oryzae TaxID=2997343 RepID=A0ABT4UTZ8_9PSEU|nr:hypothetical protein [Saccharopolyspora oryzae]MDA3625190.1 hypothetical protein [Saccharopolyspora oryzae]